MVVTTTLQTITTVASRFVVYNVTSSSSNANDFSAPRFARNWTSYEYMSATNNDDRIGVLKFCISLIWGTFEDVFQ